MNSQSFLNTIKKIIKKQINSMKLTDVLFGTVTVADPLKIKVDNRFYVDEDFLILTSNVVDYAVTVNMNWTTETASGHTHDIIGDKDITIKNALTVGEDVILLRVKNGQEFIVLDRAR